MSKQSLAVLPESEKNNQQQPGTLSLVLITCLCISLPSCPLSSQVAFFPTNRRLLQMHLAHPGSGEFPTCVTYVILKLKINLPFISSFFVFLLLPMPVTFFPLNHFISYSIFIFLSFSYFIALPQPVWVFFPSSRPIIDSHQSSCYMPVFSIFCAPESLRGI